MRAKYGRLFLRGIVPMTICNQRLGLKLGGRIIFSLLYFRKPKYGSSQLKQASFPYSLCPVCSPYVPLGGLKIPLAEDTGPVATIERAHRMKHITIVAAVMGLLVPNLPLCAFGSVNPSVFALCRYADEDVHGSDAESFIVLP